MLVVTPADFGNVVRDRRRDLEMTQTTLAEAVGMSRQWVVRFENGNAATATLDHLLRLAAALSLDVELTSE